MTALAGEPVRRGDRLTSGRPQSFPQLASLTPAESARWPVLIRVLGPFCVLKTGSPVPVRGRGKTEALLSHLALRYESGIARETLLDQLWPDSDPALASQSLNSLVHSLQRLLGDVVGGASLIVHGGGWYRFNTAVGVGVDVACFDSLAAKGDQQARAGDPEAAAETYGRAVDLYRGDLCVSSDVYAVMERERLRVRYLTLLARLADHHFEMSNYLGALDWALRLLAHDPCREDAHRLVMRCHVRRGERGQALHQYRLCESVLHAEFDASPEPATLSLFEQVRSDPDSV